MELRFWDGARAEGAVAVDAPLPTEVHLSNRPGNATPDAYRADLVVEMALALADDADRLAELDVVTTDRYTTEAVLAAWALSDPEGARARRGLIVDAAASAAFKEPVPEEALTLDLMIDQYRYGAESPLAFKFDEWGPRQADETILRVVFESLPNLFDQVDDYRYAWVDAHDRIRADRQAYADGTFVTTEEGPVTLVEAPRDPVPRATRAAVDSPFYLFAVDDDGGHRYRLDAVYHAWAETVERPSVEVPDLEGLASDLDADEPAGRGRWRREAIPDRGPTEVLRFAGPDGAPAASGLAPEDVLAAVAEALR